MSFINRSTILFPALILGCVSAAPLAVGDFVINHCTDFPDSARALRRLARFGSDSREIYFDDDALFYGNGSEIDLIDSLG